MLDQSTTLHYSAVDDAATSSTKCTSCQCACMTDATESKNNAFGTLNDMQASCTNILYHSRSRTQPPHPLFSQGNQKLRCAALLFLAFPLPPFDSCFASDQRYKALSLGCRSFVLFETLVHAGSRSKTKYPCKHCVFDASLFS